jgi:hypothetical protein
MAGAEDGTCYCGSYRSRPTLTKNLPTIPAAVRSHALFGGAITFTLPASFANVRYVNAIRQQRRSLFALSSW